MMLTAIPANPSPSVFAHNHTPASVTNSSPSQPGSPDEAISSQPPGSSAHHHPHHPHILHGMDAKIPPQGIAATTALASNRIINQGHPPTQLIPMATVQQPLLLGAGGSTGYTLIPSIQQAQGISGGGGGGDMQSMLGIQPMGGLSRTGTMQPLAALPSAYYAGRMQQPEATPTAAPLGFQQPVHLSPQQLSSGGVVIERLLPPPLTSSAHLQQQQQQPPPSHPTPHPPHTLLVSGTGNGAIVNGNQNLASRSTASPPLSSSSTPVTSHHQLPGSAEATDTDIRTRVEGGMDPHHHHDERRRHSQPLPQSYSRSRAARHASRSSTNPPSVPSEDTAGTTSAGTPVMPDNVLIKREPASDDSAIHHHQPPISTARRNSDSKLEEAAAGTSSSSKSYQISALIDIPPMAPPLNRASRTSSLSSSLSSFRFGGSLSQLWASQISLSGKINNMKSTGNINADAAAMPSLGNQYFAFGGSLPELSLTSLTRLLPNSSASDPSISSCPGLFTLPLYVYPSQQHLATPFINTHGSITFGSFLSSGSSLCSTSSKGGATNSGGSPGGGGQKSSNGDDGNNEDGKDGCGGQVTTSSTSSLNESVIKMPMYSPLSAGTIMRAGEGGGVSIVTSLPGFTSLARGLESNSLIDAVSGSGSTGGVVSSSHSHNHLLTSSSSPSSSGNLATMSGLHPPQTLTLVSGRGREADHTPQHLPTLHASPHIQDRSNGASRRPMSPPQHSDLYTMGNRSGGVGGANSMLQTVPISRIKMESTDMEQLELSPVQPCGLPIMSPPEGIHSPHGTMELPPGGGSGGHSMTPPMGSKVVGGQVIKKEKDKPYKCDHPGCERSFSFPAHLRSHIQQIHISYRPCKCEFPGCGKRFYTPQHLNVHRRVHTGERPFVCPYAECSKAFTTAGNLKNHIRTHTGERPYACKFEGCSKRFAEMSSLKKHELTHTGEKPYKCRVCGKAFSQAGSRNTHERKHTRNSEEEEGGMAVAAGDAKGSKKYRIKRISEEPMQH